MEDLEYPTNSPSSFTTADNSLYNEFGHFFFKDPNFEVQNEFRMWFLHTKSFNFIDMYILLLVKFAPIHYVRCSVYYLLLKSIITV